LDQKASQASTIQQISLKKDSSTKQLGLQNVQDKVNALQQYHLGQMLTNSNSNNRMSSSKPILGGGVAGSKYLMKN